MLGLWILLDSLSLATQLILAAMGSDMTDFSSSPLFAANAGVGCVALMAFVAMAVLQLMWVYRVHLDAGHGGYAEVSPGLALGLCFVPLFNFVWLAIVLRKLAGFAALATDRPNASAAVRLANICLVSNSLRLVLGVAGGIYGVVVGLQAAQTAGVNPNQPFYPFAGSSFAWEPWMLITPVLNLAMTVVYLWTVWRVETSLYAKIGPAA